MGSIAAAALADAVDELVVANRTVERAEQIAADFRATAVGLDALPSAVEAADVVVTATGSPDYVVDEEVLAGAGETFLVDIGQPRDVDPAAAEREHTTVRDLDALESVTDRTRDQRREAAEAVEAIIDEELDHLLTQYKRKRADQVIAAMYEGAERMKEAELRKARTQLEAAETEAEREEVLESLADALVGQLLAAPTESLRDAAEHDDWETIHTALRLFDPRVDVASEELPESMRQGMPPGAVEQFTD
jgi:glutamyl-tRNA reductase